MKHPPLIALDCETLGLGDDAPVWEVAALRIDPVTNVVTTFNEFVKVEPALIKEWLPTLPEYFQNDFRKRYDATVARHPEDVVTEIAKMSAGKALVIGSNPGIDMRWMETMARDAGHDESPFQWHYSPENVPTLARGWLNGKGVYPAPPWGSEFISRACGVDPDDFPRHTALGDALWCYALWRKVSLP